MSNYIRNGVLVLGVLITAPAKGYHLGLEEMSMQYQKFDHNRDPYVMEYTERWSYRVQMNFTYSLGGILYMANKVHTEALTSGPVKTVGWHWEIGLRLHPAVTLYHEHHSRHVMEDVARDWNGSNKKTYPVEDSYGIRFNIYENPGRRSTVWGLFN